MRSFPSLKDKKRYVVFEIISGKKHSFHEIRDAVIGAARRFLGTSGMAKAKLRVLQDRWDDEKQRGIISATRKGTDSVKAALCTVTHVEKEKVIARSLGTSGIMKKAIAKYC